MKVYRKQIDAAKAPKQTPEATPAAAPTEPTPRKELTSDQERRVDFMRDIVAQARVRG